VTTPQLAVGMFEGAAFSASAVDCRPGDVLALLTDGLAEVFDREQREWGFERAKQVLAESSREPLPAIADRLLAAARGHGEQTDDQTVLLVRRK
jgi:serine phosphatase RsbU (regulator of sigma subunit)